MITFGYFIALQTKINNEICESLDHARLNEISLMYQNLFVSNDERI